MKQKFKNRRKKTDKFVSLKLYTQQQQKILRVNTYEKKSSLNITIIATLDWWEI